MFMRELRSLSVVLTMICFSCGEKGTHVINNTDDIPPATVCDLAVGSSAVESLTLIWTAPGDDGYQGKAAFYDIRYSATKITASNWQVATQVPEEPSPKAAGNVENFTVVGLSGHTMYYFALRTRDEAANLSGLSNIVSGRTMQDTIAPAAVRDLHIIYSTASSITLGWTAPGDNGQIGAAKKYDLRYNTIRIDERNWESALRVSDEPVPSSSGSVDSCQVDGLGPHTTYFFALKTGDETPVWSPLSNVVSGTTVNAWSKTYGGTGVELGYSVAVTSDGGFVVVGSTTLPGKYSSDVYLAKTDIIGNLIWEKTLGGYGGDVGYSVAVTSDGGYIIGGKTNSFGAGLGDVYLIKTDGSGNLIWERTYGGTEADSGRAVAVTADGGYVIVGTTHSFNSEGADVYLIKTNISGDIEWEKTYPGPGDEGGSSVALTADGGFIIAAYTTSGATGGGIRLIRTDGSGEKVWGQTFSTSPEDYGNGVTPTSDGGYVVVGSTNFGLFNSGICMIKTDRSGNVLWRKTHGGEWSPGLSADQYGSSVVEGTDGGYVAVGTGMIFSGLGTYVKFDASGNKIWSGCTSGTRGAFITNTPDRGYIIAGTVRVLESSNWDIILTKIDERGNL